MNSPMNHRAVPEGGALRWRRSGIVLDDVQDRGAGRWISVLGSTMALSCLVGCALNADGQGSAGLDDSTGAETTRGSTSTTTGSADESSSSTGSSSGSSSSGGESTASIPPECGNGVTEADEDCDDANTDEADGCLSSCVEPRTCAHLLDEVPDAVDGTYRMLPDGDPLDAWCDMSEGGWTLVAKVNTATADAGADFEPMGWFGMTLAPEELAVPELTVDGPLASHGAARFSSVLGESSVAHFELISADEPVTIVHWYKRIASPTSFEAWFGEAPDTASQVCTDPEFTTACEMGTISSEGEAYTRLEGMNLSAYGYSRGDVIHMRLSGDSGAALTSICSGTRNDDMNAWPDSYNLHWGNGLRIWLRE